MNVVDAGVAVELIGSHLDPGALGDGELIAPHLIDSEVTNVLRRLAASGVLTQKQAALALEGFGGLIIGRFAADWLRPRMWELRHNLGAYDATYVALAELTGAGLLTTDVRLAAAPGIKCPVRVL